MESINLYTLAIMENMRLYPKYYGALTGEKERFYKKHEAVSLKVLVESLMSCGGEISDFDNFFLGYIIPQIGKEFDTLKIGKNIILNIELKSHINNLDDVKEQLIKNKFYLAHLGGEHYFFTFNSEDKKVYRLSEKNELKLCKISEVSDINRRIEGDENVEIDKLFAVSQFIVSPIYDSEKFLKGEYFLTQQQQIIKKKISDKFSKKSGIVKLGGSPGTGKTLLLYDIALSFACSHKILFIIWGKLTFGHKNIENYVKNIKFVPVCDLKNCKIENFDMIFADETQRYNDEQFEFILQSVANCKMCGIFAYEKRDVVFDGHMPKALLTLQNIKGQNFVLSGKIRVNEELSNFIRKMTDKEFPSKKSAYKSVNVHFADNKEETYNLLQLYMGRGYEYIVTDEKLFEDMQKDCPLKLSECKNSSDCVGKEYPKVVVVINKHYFYNDDEKLTINGEFPEKLYLALTRARVELCLIIEDNIPIFEYLLKIKK